MSTSYMYVLKDNSLIVNVYRKGRGFLFISATVCLRWTTFCWAAKVIGIPSWWEKILFLDFFFGIFLTAYSEDINSSGCRTPLKMACAMMSLAAGAGLGGYRRRLFVCVPDHNKTYYMLEGAEETFIFSSYSKESVPVYLYTLSISTRYCYNLHSEVFIYS